MPQLQGPRTADFPYAEASPTTVSGGDAELLRSAFRMGLASLFPASPSSRGLRGGFTRLARQGPRPEEELAELLTQLGGSPNPAGFRRLSDIAREGGIHREGLWFGPRRGAETGPRTQIRSFNRPYTYHLEE